MSDTYIYEYKGSLYFNLTNKCSNNCTFCLRNNGEGVGGHKLWIQKEPTADEIIEKLQAYDLKTYKEAVFCGYGEPAYKVDEIVQIAAYLKSKGVKTRLDTNGQGNLINGYDIVPKISKVIDTVSVSLNNCTAESYNKICLSEFGEQGFYAMLDFAKSCKAAGINTVFSVVSDTISDEDLQGCRALAESLGIPLRVRAYIKNNDEC